MTISIIVAVSQNHVIGKDNRLIWRMPADMAYFKEKTMGHFIITGRKNYESIPEKFRPLPNRTNVVVTRRKEYSAPGAIVAPGIEEAIALAEAKNESEVFIIGGGEIFRQTLSIAERIYYTLIHHSFEGDVFFPEMDKEIWKEISSVHFKADEKNPYDYTFFVYERNQ